MNLSWYDWMIMGGSVILLRLISLSTRKYMKGVADFLSANRSAGRYLLTIAGTMGGTGVIFFVGLFEQYSNVGFTSIWWGFMVLPIPIIALLTGWVYYRFRETRAMTMAQYFEMRYSRRFRIFAGIICWTSGIINFGIFPVVAGRFFIYFCGLPEHLPILDFQVPTLAIIMAVDLALALTFVNMGGQVSVMVTECVQGIFCGIAFVVISATILIKLSWPQMVRALSTAPENESMLHPFKTGQVDDFNFWFFMIIAFSQFYNWLSWQGTSGFNSSPRSPHEAKMGGIIGVWRMAPQLLVVLLMAIAGYAVLHLQEYSVQAAQITGTLKTIDNPTIQNQMSVPVALAFFLPLGIKGILATVILFSSFTSHDTYMHSWGSIFIQDVVMPIRKKPLDTGQHIRYLRWSIIGVAVWAFFFGLFYQQTEKIMMFCAITGTIWLGGAGVIIAGGLYWKRGTTAAAYAALIVGAALGVTRLIIPGVWESHYHSKFPINGQWTLLIGMVSSILVYIFVSLLTSRGSIFNLESMLHRGKYAVQGDGSMVDTRTPNRWLQLLGITREFTRGDKFLAIALLVWNLGWIACFVIVTAINLATEVSTEWWASFWHFYIILQFIIGIPATVWFTVGGVLDIKGLFRILATAIRNPADDGSVAREPEEPIAPQPDLEPVPE